MKLGQFDQVGTKRCRHVLAPIDERNQIFGTVQQILKLAVVLLVKGHRSPAHQDGLQGFESSSFFVFGDQ